jgi:uncharacterized phage-associated protein
MTLSAHDVAAELRRRLPGVGQVKLHKLLYYCQGHHLAHSGEPMFEEAVCAWDMGPVVEALWRAEKRGKRLPDPARITDNGILNTIGYVLSRYGTATGVDLQHMSHAEKPWQLADVGRPPGGSVLIENDWMCDYFRGEGAPTVGDDDFPVKDSVLAEMFAGRTPPPGRGVPDDLEKLRAQIADLRAQVSGRA